MASNNVPQISLEQGLIIILIGLFAVGIFSVEGGGKAWFDLILVSATLCACGYILWWQIPFLILAIILGTVAAGMIPLLKQVFPISQNTTGNNLIVFPLKWISNYNLSEISNLSVDQLEQRLKSFSEAQQVFESDRKILEQFPELESVFKDIRKTRNIAVDKVETRRKNRKKRQQEEAETKAQQKRWLEEQRSKNQLIGGYPPTDEKGIPTCRITYPIKVTFEKKDDGCDGVIWHPNDTEYDRREAKWCYTSIAEVEKEKYKKFRRPYDNQGRPRPIKDKKN